MLIRLILTAVVATFFSIGAVAQTKTAPQLQTAPQIKKVPKLTVPNPAVLAPPVGKRVVPGDLHLAMEGVSPGSVQYRRNTDKVWSEPDEALIIITGDIDMGDQEYWLAKPYITEFKSMLPGLPSGCWVGGGSFPQSSGHQWGFKLTIRFRLPDDNPRCGTYFRGLQAITLDLSHISVEWTKYGGFKKVAAAGGVPVIINLPPVQPKNPQPPD